MDVPLGNDASGDGGLLKQWITRWEGVRSTAYRDSKGIPTIGVGFNLTTAGAQGTIAALGLDYNQVLSGTVSLSAGQIDQLLVGSIQTAVASARALIPNVDELPGNQRLVMIDLTFNMGQRTLSGFRNMLACVANADWLNAAMNLQESAWFGEVGGHPTQRGGADVAVLGGQGNAADVLQASYG